MSNELLLPAATKDLSPLQHGWLKMSDMKEKTFDTLQKGELEVQGILKDIAKEKDLSKIQERIAKAKQTAAEKKEVRLFFTNTLKEKLIDKAMEFEKRNDALIATAMEHELERRKEVVKEQEAGMALATEKEQYKAHIKNEWLKIQAAYKLKLEYAINEKYVKSLEKKKNKAELSEYIANTKKELAAIQLDKPFKFQRTLVSIEEAKEIVAQSTAYNPQPDLDAAIAKVDERFAMYNEDIKNKADAIKQAELELKEVQSQVTLDLQQETAITNLIATADNIEYANGAKVNKKTVIVEENTHEWAMAVMTAFIANSQACKPHLRVQGWPKLSLSQMAAALSKLGKTFTGLKTKEQEK